MLLIASFVVMVVTAPGQGQASAPAASTQQLEEHMRSVLQNVAGANADSPESKAPENQTPLIIMSAHAGDSRIQAQNLTASSCAACLPGAHSSKNEFVGAVRSATFAAIRRSVLFENLATHLPPFARSLLTGSRE